MASFLQHLDNGSIVLLMFSLKNKILAYFSIYLDTTIYNGDMFDNLVQHKTKDEKLWTINVSIVSITKVTENSLHYLLKVGKQCIFV